MMIDTDLVYKAMTNRHYGLWPSIDDVKKMNEMETYLEHDLESTNKLYEIINKKVEEKKMKNIIKWNVTDITITHEDRYSAPRIEFNAVGYPTMQITTDVLHHLSDHIGRCLNSEMDVPSMYPAMPKTRAATTYHPDRVIPEIKDVIFNGPATIVLWKDGTKTVVKAQEGEFIDYEKGMAMAIAKRVLGNKGSYYDAFTKYLPKEEEEV